MFKESTEYSIVNYYGDMTLAFVDAKILLESFHDKGLWPKFVTYMNAVASESHVSSGTMRINEDDCERLHFMCVNSDVDTSDYKTWFNVQAVYGWYHSHGNILVDSGYIMCVTYDDIKDHIYGSGLNFVTVNLKDAYCGVCYKTRDMFSGCSSSCIKICNAGVDREILYEVDCSKVMHTGEDWEKIHANK